jgi:hypothetical protein
VIAGDFQPLCYSPKLMMRLAAFTLLLVMALDLGADFVYGETGDLALAMPTSNASSPIVSDPLAGSGQDIPSGQTHECFCCCTHLEQGEPAVVHVSLYSTRVPIHLSVSLPDGHPVHIYHPPLHVL